MNVDIISEVKKLNLPQGKYAVVGSGAIAIKGIRPAHDIDLVVTHDIYDGFKSAGWEEVRFPNTLRPWVLFKEVFDISTSWSVEGYQPDPAQLIQNAEIIEGVAFVRLEDLLKWKKACRRDKDLADIELIEAYLNSLAHGLMGSIWLAGGCYAEELF